MKYPRRKTKPKSEQASKPGFNYQIIGITGTEGADNDTMRRQSAKSGGGTYRTSNQVL